MYKSLFNPIDLLVVPVLIAVLCLFALWHRSKQPEHLRRFYFKAFLLRCLGAVSIAFIYQFVYGYGDTFQYYYITQYLRESFFNDPTGWLSIVTHSPVSTNPDTVAFVQHLREESFYSSFVFEAESNAALCKLASIFNIFCFNSYTGIALCFGFFSFAGCWYIFKTFVHFYPDHTRKFALFCLFLPSLWFWGSGILKDPICLFALGSLIFHTLVAVKSRFSRGLWIILCAAVLLVIKSYILYICIAALFTGWLIDYFLRANALGKLAIALLFGCVGVLAVPLLSQQFNDAFQDVALQTEVFINAYSDPSAAGDASNVPNIDVTPLGLLLLGLKSIFTVYLAPYPWELRKIVYLFVILENLLIWYVVFAKVKQTAVRPGKKPALLTSFSFVFFPLLAMVIGITTFNTGTVVRYRVPALPFLFAGIYSLKVLRKRNKSIIADPHTAVVTFSAPPRDNTVLPG